MPRKRKDRRGSSYIPDSKRPYTGPTYSGSQGRGRGSGGSQGYGGDQRRRSDDYGDYELKRRDDDAERRHYSGEKRYEHSSHTHSEHRRSSREHDLDSHHSSKSPGRRDSRSGDKHGLLPPPSSKAPSTGAHSQSGSMDSSCRDPKRSDKEVATVAPSQGEKPLVSILDESAPKSEAFRAMQAALPGWDLRGLHFTVPVEDIPQAVHEKELDQHAKTVKQLGHFRGLAHGLQGVNHRTRTELEGAALAMKQNDLIIQGYKTDAARLEEEAKQAEIKHKDALQALEAKVTTVDEFLHKSYAKENELKTDKAALTKENESMKATLDKVRAEHLSDKDKLAAALEQVKKLDELNLQLQNDKVKAEQEVDLAKKEADLATKELEELEDTVEVRTNKFFANVIKTGDIRWLGENYPLALANAWEQLIADEVAYHGAYDDEELQKRYLNDDDIVALEQGRAKRRALDAKSPEVAKEAEMEVEKEVETLIT